MLLKISFFLYFLKFLENFITLPSAFSAFTRRLLEIVESLLHFLRIYNRELARENNVT